MTYKKVHGLIIEIDRDACIGAAPCVALAPKAFALDGEAKAVVLDSVEQETRDMIIEAARSCPVRAIKVTDEESGTVLTE